MATIMDMNQGRTCMINGRIFPACIACFLFISFSGFRPVNAQEKENARGIIEDLAGASMHGRGFVYNGAGKAARYITRCFKENHTKPLNGSYRQDFRLDVNTFPRTVRLSVNGKLLKPAADYLPDPSSPGIKGSFGVIEINTDDILSGSSPAKIRKATKDDLLCLDLSFRDSPDPAVKKEVLAFREQMKKNASIRAAGILEVTGEKLSWSSSGTTLSKPWIIVNKAVKIDSLSRIDVSIRNRFLSGKKTNNILGVFTGNRRPDSFIVFTAHYDHLGSLGRKNVFPGANDNASGVAMLLSLNKYYAQHPPSCSVVFLSPSAEELGLLGSRYFVMHSPIGLDKIRFLINLDLVGTGEEGIMVVNAGECPREFKILDGINKNDSLVPVIKTRGEACNSDHCPFYAKGVPCFYLYTMGGSPAYHDLHDTPDAISVAAFENLKKLIIRFVEKL
jgi:aminopeptidase YwaD